MKKIIYFDWYSDASSFYQLMPLDYIKHPELDIERSTEKDIKPHLLNKYDVVIVMRPGDEACLTVIRRARDMGKKVTSIFDDDCLHLPNDIHPMYDHYEHNKKNTIECLSLSDEVWVATEGIKHSYRLYNQNIQVIPNSHNNFLFKVENKPEFTYNKIALWRGGFSHTNDIYEDGTTEYLVKLINEHPDFHFHFWGQRFEFIEKRLKQRNHYRNGGGPTLEFYQSMHMLNPCAFFYPLEDNLFNRSKSNCSWLEAIYSGACYFGSGLPEFDKPGILPFKDMSDHMNYPETLKSGNSLSWEYVCDNLLLSEINEIRKERLLSI